MSGVLHRKLPLARPDVVAFDDEPTATATPPRGRGAPVDPVTEGPDRDNRAADADVDVELVDADIDVDVDEDADTKIIRWVRERHPRIQH